MKTQPPATPEILKPRASACAKASLQAEMARIRQMTVEERILAALGMKSKFDWLEPSPSTDSGNESS